MSFYTSRSKISGEYYTLLTVWSCAYDCVCYLTIYHKSSQSELCVTLLEQKQCTFVSKCVKHNLIGDN